MVTCCASPPNVLSCAIRYVGQSLLGCDTNTAQYATTDVDNNYPGTVRGPKMGTGAFKDYFMHEPRSGQQSRGFGIPYHDLLIGGLNPTEQLMGCTLLAAAFSNPSLYAHIVQRS
jgi:hypothetical protein